MLKVRDVSRKPSSVLRKETSITTARALLRRSGERILPIIDENGRVSGFITRRETVIVTSAKSALRTVDVARSNPVLLPEMDVDTAYRIMTEQRVWEAPVVSDPVHERLEGVFSFRDLIEKFMEEGFEPKARSVADVMTVENLDLMLMTPDEKVTKAWSRLVLKGLPGIVVVRSKENPVPVGLITIKNLVDSGRWRFHREAETKLSTPAKIKTIMTRGVVVATPETPLEHVARFMVENDVDVVPVIDKAGHVVGIVTQADVARAYIEGVKPGRKPVKPVVVVKHVSEEERVVYVSEKQLIEQVLEKPTVEVPREIGLTVKDAVVPELPAISIDDTVEHARKVMLRTRSNYVIVTGQNGSIVGVVSKWNMLKAIGTKGPYWKRRVYDKFFIDYVMTRNPPKVKMDDPIEKVALEMFNTGSDVAIVVDENDEIMGFVTKESLVKVFVEKAGLELLVENVMTPAGIGIVHPHHTLAHVISKMKTYMLDAITVADANKIIGVVSANRLPFVAYENARTGRKSRRLIWVRKLVRGAAKFGRYVRVTPLLAIDATAKIHDSVKPTDTLYKAYQVMEKNNVDGVPVVDNERVIGVISKYDILREIVRRAKIAEERVKEIAKKVKKTA
ncbi:MAG: CBS domain-containing protein [Desulfurococcales archaeon]|nr:CBS domain-containing protein [Desulfurococcales archaeon]